MWLLRLLLFAAWGELYISTIINKLIHNCEIATGFIQQLDLGVES